MSRNHLQAILVHLYTGVGGIISLFVAVSIAEQRFDHAFLLLFLALLVDGSDGFLARKYQVKKFLSWLDGAMLDEVIDFLTYTFLPLLLLWAAGLLPAPMWLWSTLILISSMYGFTHVHPLKSAGIFSGLPAIWNVYAFYAFYHQSSQVTQVLVIATLLVATFVPIHFIHLTRFFPRRALFLAGLWILLCALAVVRPMERRLLLNLSLVFPLVYFVFSLVVHFRWWGLRFVLPGNDALPAGWPVPETVDVESQAQREVLKGISR
jgi:phosphatidylcholine synthase